MSAPDPNKWEQVTGTVVEISGEKRMRGAPPPDPSLMEGEETSRGLDLGYLDRLMGEKLSSTPELSGARLRRDAGRLVLSLPNDLLFAGGDATLSSRGRAAIFALSVALDTVDNRLLVRGHTDPRPLAGVDASQAIGSYRWPVRCRSPKPCGPPACVNQSPCSASLTPISPPICQPPIPPPATPSRGAWISCSPRGRIDEGTADGGRGCLL